MSSQFDLVPNPSYIYAWYSGMRRHNVNSGFQVDLNSSVVLIRDKKGAWEDRTSDIKRCVVDKQVKVTFNGSGKPYPYGRANVCIRPLTKTRPPDSMIATAGSAVVRDPAYLAIFQGPDGKPWNKVASRPRAGSTSTITASVDSVRWVPKHAEPATTSVVDYWQTVVDSLPEDNTLHDSYPLGSVPANDALGLYLSGSPPRPHVWSAPIIYPFNSNLSQRRAVEQALTHSLSVIQGPPGTGKTETILNILANVVTGGGTVGIVSSSNAAVDNVYDKLVSRGFGLIAANLGNRAKRDTFFKPENQSARNEAVRSLPFQQQPDYKSFRELDRKVNRLQQAQRELASATEELRIYELEQQHFLEHLKRQQLPELESFPLLKKSSKRIIRYLAETTLREGTSPGFFTRLIQYFRYGSTARLAPSDTDVVLRLQEAFFERRIDELRGNVASKTKTVRSMGGEGLAERHQQVSEQVLRFAVGNNVTDTQFYGNSYRKSAKFRKFIGNYPVVLSSCHSLEASLAPGFVLDYLIIDEASQVAPMLAAIAMTQARNVVIVGDSRQLPPVVKGADDTIVAPVAAYDCFKFSILTSVLEVFGDRVPQTLLREHYRCHPAIIGFCNKKFYDGELLPFANVQGSEPPMTVWRTSPGNHMRAYGKASGGGYANQRQADAIVEEVIAELLEDIDADDIGVIAPYRRQVSKIGEVMDEYDVETEADTVHSFQGRQQRAIVFSTVVDQSQRGKWALKFAEKPELVNVAVSRAAERFVMVIDNSLLPKSRLFNDLAGYIAYQNPDQPFEDSGIVSVFDLLYKEYSSMLDGLAGRIENSSTYRSESIASTVLQDVLAEPEFLGLGSSSQVRLANLFPDRESMNPREVSFVKHPRSSVDFVVWNAMTYRPVLAIEVDGFAFHENNPEQLERDEVKDGLCKKFGLDLLRLPTTGSREPDRIRHALRAVL